MQDWRIETSGRRVRTILEILDRTQVEMARIIGVSPVTINRWVKGRSVPDPRCREKLEMIEDRYVRNRDLVPAVPDEGDHDD